MDAFTNVSNKSDDDIPEWFEDHIGSEKSRDDFFGYGSSVNSDNSDSD